MKFQYYRFFLSPIEGNLFSQLPNSKEKAIENIFNNDFNVFYKNMNYSISSIKKIGDISCFKIAKHTSIQRTKSPEENFEKEQIEHWPNVNMIIGLNSKINDSYGQIIAIEQNSTVLKTPINILRLWADEQNKLLYNFGYFLSINPISYKKSFWEIVKKYKNQIEELVFEYSMPNLFNTGDCLEQDLKNANRNFNATKAKIVFTNKNDSLNLSEDNQLLQQSANYIDNGGGEFKLKVKGEKTHIMSVKRIKTQKFEIQDLNIKAENSDEITMILSKILEINE